MNSARAYPSSLAGLLQLPAIGDLDRAFLLGSDGQEWSARDYQAHVAGAAKKLRAAGITAGTLVSWQLPTSFDAVVIAGALALIGARQNPILPLYGGRELAFILDECQPAFFIARNLAGYEEARTRLHHQPQVMEAPPGAFCEHTDDIGAVEAALDADTVRWIFYSSGTTANPKGAMHTDGSLIAGAAAMVERYAFSPQDRYGMIFPFSHIGGLQMLVAQLLCGASAVLFERFAGEETFAAMSKLDMTLLSGGTPAAQLALAVQRKSPDRIFPRLRAVMTGAAPKPPGLHRELREELGGIGSLSCYGMTEAPMGVLTSHDDPEIAKAQTEGSAIPGSEIRIVSLGGKQCAPGEVGEIRVRGPQVMQGYVDKRLNQGAFDEEGFFGTGDLGSLDQEGFVRVVGRLKDIIIRKGENISAAEVEDVIARHPEVAEVAAIGLPDPVSGERCCAVLTLVSQAGELNLEQLARYCLDAGLARFKTPEQLEIVSDMPRNASGKVMKSQLVKRFASAEDGTP